MSGFFWRLTPTELLLGVGGHCFEKSVLTQYRKEVADEKSAAALLKAVGAVEKAEYEVEGEHYKRVPRGFEVEDERRAALLRHDGLYAGKEEKHPAALHSAKLVNYSVDRWKKLLPLHRWLVDTLQ